MSGDIVWYVFQDAKQAGPFDDSQIRELLNNRMIAQDAYLFKTGWKDWRPLLECAEELNQPAPPQQNPSYVQRAPRASIGGKIIIHNNGQLIIGAGVDISNTGMFVKTSQELFKVGETLKLTCKVDGMQKGFLVQAKVARLSEDPVRKGYGLQFLDLPQHAVNEIESLISKNGKQKAS